MKMTFKELSYDDDNYEYMHLKSIEKILEEIEDDENHNEPPTSKYKLITRRIDSNKIRHKIANNPEIHTSVCKNIKLGDETPVRSGAIIYKQYKGKTYFCLGVDSRYGDLTDFAGGVKKDEMILENGIITGGLRELEEESLGIFGKLSFKDVSENLGFYSSNMLIMFIKLDVDIEATQKDFISKVERMKSKIVGDFSIGKELEVSEICWMEKDDLLESISGRGKRLYSRVRKILSKVTEIISAL